MRREFHNRQIKFTYLHLKGPELTDDVYKRAHVKNAGDAKISPFKQ